MTRIARRSWLITPAHDAARLEAAARSDADVVVLDLQDMVHDSRKHEARANVRDAIGMMRDSAAEAFVRCDVELMYADLDASVWRGLSGVVLPGAESAEQVREADALLAKFEAERGVVLPPPIGEVREADDPRTAEQALEIHLSLDTARANWDAEALIRASERVRSVSLGRADLAMDLRAEPSGELHMMPYLMQRLIIIANALGVDPVGAWWRASSRGLVDTPANTLAAARDGRAAGFRGGMCASAEQARSLNAGFAPTAPPSAGDDAIDRRLTEWADACAARERAKQRHREQTS